MHLKGGTFRGIKIFVEWDPWYSSKFMLIANVGNRQFVQESTRLHRGKKKLIKRLARVLSTATH